MKVITYRAITGASQLVRALEDVLNAVEMKVYDGFTVVIMLPIDGINGSCSNYFRTVPAAYIERRLLERWR